MKKNNKLDMKSLSKKLGTKLHKTEKDIGEFIRLRTPTVKGVVYDDGSGGLTLKVPGLDCFISHGKVLDQIEEIENTVAAYLALKPDLKKLKAALKAAQIKIPDKPKVKSNAKQPAKQN